MMFSKRLNERVLREFVRQHIEFLLEERSYEDNLKIVGDFFGGDKAGTKAGVKSGTKSSSTGATDDVSGPEASDVDMGKNIKGTGASERLVGAIKRKLAADKSTMKQITTAPALSSLLQKITPELAPSLDTEKVKKAYRNVNSGLTQVKPEKKEEEKPKS